MVDIYAEEFNFSDLHHAAADESDLGLLISGAMIMEWALRRVLETVLSNVDELNLFHNFQVLGGYRAKLDMCRALGLVDGDVWIDLKTINDLRNDAAHLKMGPRLNLSDSPFKERIAELREIQILRSYPELLQEDLPRESRTGVLYEESRSQLYWSLIELLIKLQKVAPAKLRELPPQKYKIGDRVRVQLHPDYKVRDLKGRSDATGTIVETPGNIVYNVLLDDPPDPAFNTLTYLGEKDIIEAMK